MKLGIIGLSGCGKTTIFEALTHNFQDTQGKGEDLIGTITVPDQRVDLLRDIYQPKKTIYAQVEYFLPGASAQKREKSQEQPDFNKIRDCDALIHVVRNFEVYGYKAPSPLQDFTSLDEEITFSDFLVVEKRLGRLDLDQKRGNKINPEEISLLNECKRYLENELPIRRLPELAGAPLLKGFALVSAKPVLVLFNNTDDDNDLPKANGLTFQENSMVIRGILEKELAQMSPEEAADFLSEFEITASAMDRVIKRSYELLGLISFFTIRSDEVRAWTIKSGMAALEAAGTIHTDMKKGFIRAEVLSHNDLIDAGSYGEAKKKGVVRLEGKAYEVKDGDIITFRFNV